MSEIRVKWSSALIDIITLGIGGIILLIFVTSVTPTRRGIYCEDETIRYPFKPSTVPNYLLYIYGFTIPFVLITVTEVVINRRSRSSGHFIFRSVPSWILYLYRSLTDFLFGMVGAQLVTDVGKYTIGRLRPNFISVCGPDIDFSNCAKYNHAYITDYNCTNSETDASESRVSFPSGHSSFSAFTMFYCAIYIQAKWCTGRSNRLRLLKHGAQVLLIMLAYFTALSRVMDNKHHWSDVTAGALIGVIAACLTGKYVARFDQGSLYIRAPSNKEAHLEGIAVDDRVSPKLTPKNQAWKRFTNSWNSNRTTLTRNEIV